MLSIVDKYILYKVVYLNLFLNNKITYYFIAINQLVNFLGINSMYRIVFCRKFIINVIEQFISRISIYSIYD